MGESRTEDILSAILNDRTYDGVPESRVEQILLAILNHTAYTAEAQSRIEAILLCILNGTDLGIVPQSRVETILECIYNGEAYTGDTQSRIEELLKQISEKEPTPPTPTTFTATFIRADGDGGGTLYTQTDIPAGTVPVYGGETPTTTKGSATDYPFKGWTPALAPITEDTTYTAVFGGVEVVEIADSWDQIIASIDDGSYSSKYNVGNYKPLDLGAQGVINMQIVAMDADELADGNGNAPLTFVGTELLNNKANAGWVHPNDGIYTWETAAARKYMNETNYPLCPSNVRTSIKDVKKGYYVNNPRSTKFVTDKIWLLSAEEMFGIIKSGSTLYSENTGLNYTSIFKDNAARIKKVQNTGSAQIFMLRTIGPAGNSAWRGVSTSGQLSACDAGSNFDWHIVLGFCLGRSEG